MRSWLIRLSLIGICALSVMAEHFDNESIHERTFTFASKVANSGILDDALEAEINAAYPKAQALENKTDVLVNQIDRVNKKITKVGPSSSMSPEALGCKDCKNEGIQSSMNYASCNSHNDYMENSLEKIRDQNSLMGKLTAKAPSFDLINPKCTKYSLETSSRYTKESMTEKQLKHSPFYSCEGSSTPIGGQLQPCVSENYHNLVQNSVDLVARCMLPMLSKNAAEQKDDMRQMLGLFDQESGFHVNSVSYSGAAGIGQFTQDAIDNVNRNDLRKIRKQLTSSNAPTECSELNDQVMSGNPPMQSSIEDRCDRMSLEKKNPLLNLVYTFATIADNKRNIRVNVTNDPLFSRFFTELSARDLNRLNTILAVWAHNTGGAGLSTPLLALLHNEYHGGKKVQDVDSFLQKLKVAMREFPNRKNSSPGRIRETSMYESYIESKLSDMEVAGGGTCVQ